MRAVLQRVASAKVFVNGNCLGQIGPGLAVLVAALKGDSQTDSRFIAHKICTLRIFPDSAGKLNLSLKDVGGSVLLVSQFTLAADTTSGTRPSFSKALGPAAAQALLAVLEDLVVAQGLQVETGKFGAQMLVEIMNDGPLTIILDSQHKQRK